MKCAKLPKWQISTHVFKTLFLFCFVFSQGVVRFICVLSVEVVNRARLLCQLSLSLFWRSTKSTYVWLWSLKCCQMFSAYILEVLWCLEAEHCRLALIMMLKCLALSPAEWRKQPQTGGGNHNVRCGVKDKKEKRLVGAGQDHRGCLFMRKSKSTCWNSK